MHNHCNWFVLFFFFTVNIMLINTHVTTIKYISDGSVQRFFTFHLLTSSRGDRIMIKSITLRSFCEKFNYFTCTIVV